MIKKVGDWVLAKTGLKTFIPRLHAATRSGLLAEAHLFRKEIVVGITNQAPGDKPFLPLSPTTLAKRKETGFTGTKALIVRADLRNSVTVKLGSGGKEVFVGVLRSAKGRDGQPLVNIAEINEYGKSFVITKTIKMMNFLHMIFRAAGIGADGGGRLSGTIAIRIPPRPFMGPVFDKLAPGASKRLAAHIAKRMAAK